MKEKVPLVDILIFGSYDGKFGYKVYATNEDNRDYVLCAVAHRLKKGRNKGKYEVREEIRDNSDKLLGKSRAKGIINTKEEAGSFCFIYVKNDLCDKLGEHLRGNSRIEKMLERNVR